MKVIHQCGGLAIPPHPYDMFRAGIREPILDQLPIDALEVFNAAISFREVQPESVRLCAAARPADDGIERRA